MTTRSRTRVHRREILYPTRRILTRCDTGEVLDPLMIAELSAAAINGMSCEVLVRMIRAANLPARFRSDLDQHLPFYDHTVLIRLAHLARRCCRTRGPGVLGEDAS
jgi:hypothetical protein